MRSRTEVDSPGSHPAPLPEALTRLRRARAQTLARIATASQERLDWSPTSERWSIGEVLDHVVRMETYFRSLCTRLVERAERSEPTFLEIGFDEFDPSPRFLSTSRFRKLAGFLSVLAPWVPFRARELFARYRIVKMRAPSVGEPRAGRSAASLVADLQSAIDETTVLFEDRPDLDATRLKVHHPFFGTVDVVQLLTILAIHEHRHQLQIRDLDTARRETR